MKKQYRKIYCTKLIAYGLLTAVLTFQSKSAEDLTYQDALDQGTLEGHKINNDMSVDTTDPDAIVPGYQGSDTPESHYYENPTGVDGAASQAASDSKAAETVREGHFNRPQFTIDPDSDPVIQHSESIMDDPQSIAGSIEEEYSECTTESQTTPSATEDEVCHGFTAREDKACKRKLIVTCSLHEDEVVHPIPAIYSIVSYDTSGDNEWCHINFTESRGGTQYVKAHFKDDCRTCDPIGNPLQYAEFGEVQCKSTWEYKLKISLADLYEDLGVIQSITFHDQVLTTNGRATIEVLEKISECNWREYWDNSACDGLDIPKCVLIDDICVDGPSTHIIEGREVERACWEYKASYSCLTADATEEPYCDELRDRGCTQIDSHCVAQVENHCTEFENRFQCPAGTDYEETVVDCSGQIYCLGGSCFDTAYPPNNGLARASTYMAALDEMAKDFDPDSLTIFNGEALECSKAVLGFKNCCKNSGWGVDMGLDQCSDEEEMLGTAREASRCHRIGSYCANRDFFGVCTSRHTVFCCFSSKLARIIQEQGRIQLGRGWGNTDDPQCQGFTPEELQQIDFSAIDFSDFYADALNDLTPLKQLQLQQELEQKLQDRVDQDEN